MPLARARATSQLIFQSINLARMLWHQRAPREAIRRFQNREFLRLFQHAYDRVPFYRSLYRDHDISRNDIRSLADITKLPVVEKPALQAAASSGSLWPGDDRHKQISTSGSTGAPFTFRVGTSDDRWRKAQYLVPYLMARRKPWDAVLHFSWRSEVDQAWYRHGGIFRDIPARADAPVTQQYAMLVETRPDFVQGYPSMLRLLARYVLDRRLPCPPLKSVFTDSEFLSPETRGLIERAFGTRVYDVFGSYETGNIAFDCGLHDGLHVLEDCVYVETGPGREGSVDTNAGELICTVLHSRVTPFIRYNLGDLVRIDRGRCDCRRDSPRMIVLEGRNSDLLKLPDGSFRNAMSLVQNCREATLRSVLEFQIRQLAVARFECLVVPGPDFGFAARTGIEAVFAKLLPHAEVRVRSVENIERTNAGKYRAFVRLAENTA